MYQRILIPIDSNHTADRALQEISHLATKHTEILLLYIVEDIYPLDVESYALIDYTQLQKASNQMGQNALTQAKEKLSAQEFTQVNSKLLNATPSQHIVDLICQTADEWQAELILIGTHGRKGFNRLLLGSVAESVIRNVDIPVLLLRVKAE